MNESFKIVCQLFRNGDESKGPGRKAKPVLSSPSECLRRRSVGMYEEGEQRTVPLEVSFARNQRGTETMMLLAKAAHTELPRGLRRRLERQLKQPPKRDVLEIADKATAKRIRRRRCGSQSAK